MLRRVQPREEGRPAGRTHTGVAERLVECQAVLAKPRIRREIFFFPAFWELFEVRGLISDDKEKIRAGSKRLR